MATKTKTARRNGRQATEAIAPHPTEPANVQAIETQTEPTNVQDVQTCGVNDASQQRAETARAIGRLARESNLLAAIASPAGTLERQAAQHVLSAVRANVAAEKLRRKLARESEATGADFGDILARSEQDRLIRSLRAAYRRAVKTTDAKAFARVAGLKTSDPAGWPTAARMDEVIRAVALARKSVNVDAILDWSPNGE